MLKNIWNRMSNRRRLLSGMLLLACMSAPVVLRDRAHVPFDQVTGTKPVLTEPRWHRLWPVFNPGRFVGWSDDHKKPETVSGLKISLFADKLFHPQWLYLLPNGDILVSESNAPISSRHKPGFLKRLFWHLTRREKDSSPDRIVLLRDSNHDGKADQKSIFIDNLHSPFGIALKGDRLYVATSDAILAYPYKGGEDHITAPAQQITALPAGDINLNWTRNILLSPDGRFLYVTVGSATNIADKGMALEKERAAVWEIDLQNNSHRLYTTGLRNPVGMAFHPETKALWSVVDERDNVGSDMVPDYLTQLNEGDYYGWPQFYWGGYPDRHFKKIDKLTQSTVTWPDYSLGAHVTPLALVFAHDPASGNVNLGDNFKNGAFISEHGSLYRYPWSGYQVVFVPFNDKGEATGKPITVVKDFRQGNKVYGLPAGMTGDASGALLIADEASNRIWRLSKD